MKLNYRNVCSALTFFLLFSSVTQAQNILTSQDQITMTAQPDGSVLNQTVHVTSSGTALLVTVSLTTYNTGNWLFVSPSYVQTGNDIVVSASAIGLPNGIYNGAITLKADNATNSPKTILVSLAVGTTPPDGTSGLSVTPTALNFVGQAGGLPPGTQQLGVTSVPSGAFFGITAGTNDNGNWLQVAASTLTAPATVQVSVNTAGMATGVYSGWVLLTPTSGSTTKVPVTLTLGGGATLRTNTSAIQFFYQIGWFYPTYQTFEVSSTSGPLTFAVATSTTDGTHWLSATPIGGTTTRTINVSVAPGSLGPGTYTGKITVSSISTINNTLEIPVTFVVSNSALLTAGPSPATFAYQNGGALPPAQSVAIGSTSAPIDFTVGASTADGKSWLAVSPLSGTTPKNLTVVVNPGTLSAGTYTGTISVKSAVASNSPVQIPVTMVISSDSQLTASVQSVNFNYQPGGASQVYAQPVGVYSTGEPVTVAVGVSTSTCGANWLRSYDTTITTPQVITIAFDPMQVPASGNCQGAVTLTPTSGGSSVVIPVSLIISATPLLNIKPLSLSFTAPFEGATTSAQQILLAMTDNSVVSYTAEPSTVTGGNWMKVTGGSGTTPASVKVSADPTGLGVGTYTGNLVVGSSALRTGQNIPITFKVTATETATVAPLALSFAQSTTGAAPASQNITIASVHGGTLAWVVTTSAADSGSWLSATPNTGTTPGTISVKVNGSGLPAGVYRGTVGFRVPAATNSPLSVPVTFVVTTGQTIAASPASLAFSSKAGGTSPAAQTMSVTTTSPGVTVTSSSTGGWLSVTPASIATPAAFTVQVDTTGLQTGTYNGTVTLTAAGVANSPLSIPVKLEVLPSPSAIISEVANAASGVRGAISPGEIVAIKGESMGPAEGVSLKLTADGKVDTTLAGTRVLFDEVAAPILYTSAGQVNLVVPYEVSGRNTVQLVVEYQGVKSAPYTMQTSATAPGIFTVTQNGRGQGAILNQDNSYNSSAAPAAVGSIVQVFATGEGVTRPDAQTGSVTSGTFLPVAPVSAAVGGIPAEIKFAGAAPGSVAGLVQVNVVIPAGVPSGDVAIALSFGSLTSPSGVTVAVK